MDTQQNDEIQIDPETQKVLDEEEAQDKIKLKQAGTRNVIFVGRTRVGKSTLFKVLRSPTNLATFGSLFSDTKGASLSTFTVEAKDGPDGSQVTNYTLNAIDTPGLFELVSDGGGRTNEQIKGVISKCLEFEITRIHAIFFVCSFTSGINDEDIKSFRQFLKLFDGAEEQIAMIITRTEGWGPSRKKQLLKDINDHPGLADLRAVVKNKIFFSGAIDEDLLDGLDVVERRYKSVSNSRKEIYEFIFKSENSFPIKNMDAYRKESLQVGNVLAKLLKIQEDGRKVAKSSPQFAAMLKEEESLFNELKAVHPFISSGQEKVLKQINAGRLSALP